MMNDFTDSAFCLTFGVLSTDSEYACALHFFSAVKHLSFNWLTLNLYCCTKCNLAIIYLVSIDSVNSRIEVSTISKYEVKKETKRNKHVEKQHSHFEQLPKIATINSINYERKKQQFYTVCCVEVSRKVYLPSYCLGFLFISPKLNGHLDATTLFGFRICSQEGRFV